MVVAGVGADPVVLFFIAANLAEISARFCAISASWDNFRENELLSAQAYIYSLLQYHWSYWKDHSVVQVDYSK